MAFTTADLTALDEAIANGTKEVRINGRSKVYQNLDQMIEARKFIAEILAEQSQTRRRRTAYRISTCRAS